VRAPRLKIPWGASAPPPSPDARPAVDPQRGTRRYVHLDQVVLRDPVQSGSLGASSEARPLHATSR
jgi:hypothetical protein